MTIAEHFEERVGSADSLVENELAHAANRVNYNQVWTPRRAKADTMRIGYSFYPFANIFVARDKSTAHLLHMYRPGRQFQGVAGGSVCCRFDVEMKETLVELVGRMTVLPDNIGLNTLRHRTVYVPPSVKLCIHEKEK